MGFFRPFLPQKVTLTYALTDGLMYDTMLSCTVNSVQVKVTSLKKALEL